MGVTALAMDVITEKSGHQVTPCAVSVCTTPAAPSPLPIPYPVLATAAEGLSDTALRTKVTGSPVATVGSVFKGCHGNEPGTLKEVVSLNTAGPCFIIMGAPVVLCELGMMGITGSACISNKAPTPGANGTASGAGGAGGAGGGAGGGGAAPSGPGGPSGPSNGGGGGGGGNSGASAAPPGPGDRAAGAEGPPGSSSGPADQHQCQGGHPVDLVTGNVVDSMVDIALPGRIPLNVKRVYSSARHADRTASMGPGWANGLEQHVRLGERSISWCDSEGRWVRYELVPIGGKSFHRGSRSTLIREGELDFRIEDHAARLSHSFRPLLPGGVAALRSTRDGYGNAIIYDHADGRLTSVTDTAGRNLLVRWRGPRIVRLEVVVAGSVEQWVDYEYDDSGMLVSVSDALGHTDELEYDGHGRMTSATTKSGVRFQYKYDADSGRCARTWGPNGLYAIELEYDFDNRLTRVFGEESRIVEWDDQPGLSRRLRLIDGTVLEEVARDSDGFVIARVNGAGEGTRSWFDARGNEVRRVDPTGAATTWTYDERDCPIQKTTPDGAVTAYQYDAAGSLLSILRPSGNRTSLSYDERGRVTRIRECPRGEAETTFRSFQYDALSALEVETDSRGATTRYVNDSFGRPLTQTDALGRATTATRDRLGRATSVRYPDGTIVQRTFDAAGRVVREVDAGGGVTELSWVGMGKLGRAVDPDGRAWRLEYNAHERLAKVTNPLGEVYVYTRDEAGRVIACQSFDGRTTRFTRDAAGRVVRVEYADGSWVARVFDRGGSVLGESDSDGGTVTFRRDARARVIEAQQDDDTGRHTLVFERDPLGRVVTERQGDRVVRYERDARGKVVARTLADGSVTRFEFDSEAWLSAVSHAPSGGAAASYDFERDLLGREIRRADGRGVFSHSHVFDDGDRVIEERVSAALAGDQAPDVLVQRQYRYDRSGRVTRIDDATFGASSFAYDQASRLVEEASGGARRTFKYDAASSLVGALAEATSGGAARWKMQAAKLMETESAVFTYDKRGRRSSKRERATGVTTDYRWDVRDRLREVKRSDGVRVTFAYDALDRRVRKEVHGGPKPVTTEYVWDGDHLCAELSQDRRVRAFVHHPNDGTPLLQAENGEVLLVVNDLLGTPKELIDRGGRVAWAARHDAWGRVLEERWDAASERDRGYRVRSPFRLLGQYADDETGLTATRFRVFDPGVGRWLSPDPLGLAGGRTISGFDGAPTHVVDPLGLTSGNEGGNPHQHAASGAEVTEQTVRDAMKDAPLAPTQDAVSLPAVQAYVDRLAAGDEAPPIRVADGMVVEGHHRYVAGRIYGQEPAQQEYVAGSKKPGSWDDVKVDETDWGNR